jgi:GNAT superfamily N-acetyltransferase
VSVFAPVDPPADDAAVPQVARDLGLPGIVDLHVHLLPARLQARIWEHFDAAGPLIGREWPIRYRWPVPALIDHLRSMGVRRFPTMPYAHKPGVAAELCRDSLRLAADNPDVLGTVTLYPEPSAPDYVAAALSDGARVAKVHLQVGDVDPREPVLDPVWGLLAEAGIPVVIHAGSGPVPGRYTGVAPLQAVLERHLDLVAVIAHLGAPETSEFLDLVESREHTYLDTTMSFTDFMTTMLPVPGDELARLARLADRIVFGSDLPSIPYPYAHAIEALDRLQMGPRWMRAVLWDTATRLLDGPQAVTVATAAPDEVRRAGELVVHCYVGGGFVGAENPYVASLADVARRAREADLLVARDAWGEVIGTVTYAQHATPWAEISRPGEAEFRMLAVEPASTGRGAGRALVQACLDRARDDGASAVVISTTPQMRDAHRLYERMGFVRTPERDWSPRPGVDLWTYRAEVGEAR